ncbi:transmembrane protein 214 isoform X1 [Glossina fuscipes]|uniref:Transmembrane protein 214 isoform X1 n=1 Tax=Glossina fuscipes TaxID=7396 RepID=A0A9C5ZDS1_9MUSC|nr:transmembrane protein 214 isoform X1 [Glossina fuscipes]
MSNNRWEIVTNPKRQLNLQKRIDAQATKRKETALPKLEGISLIVASVQLYNKLIKNYTYDNQFLVKDASNGLKSGKKQRYQSEAILGHSRKGFGYSRLKRLLSNLKIEELEKHLEFNKKTYPDSKLTWLKELATFLNDRITGDYVPDFPIKFPMYPASLLSLSYREALIEFLGSVGETNLDYFYHYTLLETMCTNMSNDMPVLSIKLLLQLVGHNWPHMCTSNLANTVLLRNSYQNQYDICLSLLWAVSQCGYVDLSEGIRIFQNVMLPILEMDKHSYYILAYMENILKLDAGQGLSLSRHEFFTTLNAFVSLLKLDTVHSCKLNHIASTFLYKFITNSTELSNIFLQLICDLGNDGDDDNNDLVLYGCRLCLQLSSDECLKVWKMNLKKQVSATKLLLKNLNVACSSVTLPMHSLFEIEAISLTLPGYEQDELLPIIKSLQEKTSNPKKGKQSMHQKKKSGGCRKWALGSLILIITIIGVLLYDTEVNGKGVFAKSSVGKVLENAGVLPSVEKAWYTTMSAAARAYKWTESKTIPYSKPFLKMSCDLFKMLRNAFCNIFSMLKNIMNARLPQAAEFLDQYVPGLSKKIENTAESVKRFSFEFYAKVGEFFMTQVLIGRLSPQNLSKTLNHTQNLALEYYQTFHKKVDAYAKLK